MTGLMKAEPIDKAMLEQPGALAVARPASSSHWHVFLATWLGGVFDGMDSSIFAIVLYPALSELLKTSSYSTVGLYGSYIIALFMLGWALGSMVFGMLADYIGRARTLMITILLYAVCTGLCATANSWWEMGVYRFLVGAGIGGEMGIGAVMLSECWPSKTRRYAVSMLGTSLGVGYLLTASLNLGLGHLGWRYLFVAGIIPAFLTIYIRSKLKEPEEFRNIQEERCRLNGKAKEHLTDEERHFLKPTIHLLFTPENRRKTLIVGALTSCAIIAWWAVLSWIPAWINQLTAALAVEQRSQAMFFKDFGMILSGLLGGFLIKRLGYSRCMAITFGLAFVSTVGMFLSVKEFTPVIFPFILAVGFFAHVPFVLLWAYIPELFETRIRSTAFGITYNMGRVLAALSALGSGGLIAWFGGSYALAASTVATVFLVGMVVAFFMPQPCGKILGDS